jgi:hypothetical protein
MIELSFGVTINDGLKVDEKVLFLKANGDSAPV